MVIHDGSNRQSPMKRSNLRTCFFYLQWLGVNRNFRTAGVNHQDAESCRQAANQLINHYVPDKNNQARLLAEMDESHEDNILPTESFNWINQDQRAAFWTWAYLCKAGDLQIGINKPDSAECGKNWYEFLQLNMSPTSHQERTDLIITFFDRTLIPTPLVKHQKTQLMERLKDKWKYIYNKPTPLKWLPNEEEAVSWAWESLYKIQQEKIGPIDRLYFNQLTPGLTTWFAPFSHTERYLALRGALDIWDDAPDSKRLFLLNLNKAWNQQKLRQSRTDKKALNTYLKNETKIRLDFMADRSGLRISDMLEKLINEHYRKTCGGE